MAAKTKTKAKTTAPDRSAEASFVADYRKKFDFPRPSVAVDLLVFRVHEGARELLAIRRGHPPYQDHWAFPGGFLDVGDAFEHQGESLEAAAMRELEEETGLAQGSVPVRQFHVFGDPGRDPRIRTITVAFLALVPGDGGTVKAGDDAADAEWLTPRALARRPLAFDHAHVLVVALAALRRELETSDLAASLVPKTFTMDELRPRYAAAHGGTPEAVRRALRRLEEDGILQRRDGTGRTARWSFRALRG